MRTSFESVCGALPRQAKPRRTLQPAPALAGTTAAGGVAFPTIPVVAQGVPAKLDPTANTRTVARLADFLIQAGTIRSRNFPRQVESLDDVCQAALDTWLSEAIGELNCFTPCFDLQLMTEADDATIRGVRPGRSAAISDPIGIEICWKEGSVCHWGIGPGLDYLEKSVPQLGSTVLDLMERKGSHAYPLFTPGLALNEASYLYWRGEDDETLALDEDCGDNEAERAAMAKDMVTRADIEKAFPAWALDYHRPTLSAATLTTITVKHPCDYVRRAAQLAIALHNTRTTAQYCPEQDGSFTGFGAVLCWNDGDLAVQISDDYASHAWQGEYSDEIGKVALLLDDPATMRQWQRKVRPNLSAIGLLDSLIWHLAARE